MNPRTFVFLLCGALAACSGGGGYDANNPQPAVTAPAIAYGVTSLALTTGVPLSALTPTNTGGVVTTWSVAPALPSGLALSATNGAISGTPTAASSAASYVVRAENSAGASTQSFTIAIESGVVLELGHGAEVDFARYDGSRVLSGDTSRHWVLWSSQTAASLANGDSTCANNCAPFADLAGPTFVVKMSAGFDIRASSDGRALASIAATPSWWRLASDGSYLAAGDKAGLTIWSPTGSVLVARAGDYSAAKVFAAPSEVRVGDGPAGTALIENVAVPSGTSSVTPAFAGNFHSWFGDGQRFLTNINSTVYVFSKNAVQHDVASVQSLGGLAGYGGWFWEIVGSTLHVYAVGSSAVPAASFSQPGSVVPSGSTLGLLQGQTVSVVDLSGPTLITSAPLGVKPGRGYAAVSAAQWVVSNVAAQLVDLTSPGGPRYFGVGRVTALVGTPQRAVVALANGEIRYFDATSKAQEGSIAFAAGDLEISADGTVLFASARTPYSLDWTLKVFALPSAAELKSWPYTSTGTPKPWEISLDGSGQLFGKVLDGPSIFLPRPREVTRIDGTVVWSDAVAIPANGPTPWFPHEVQVLLSPNGSHIAVADEPRSFVASTKLYTNAVLAGAANGWAVGWIDDNRLLVNLYRDGRAQGPLFTEAVIAGPTGAPLGAVALPELTELQSLGAERVYSAGPNKIFSLTTGSAIWTTPNPTRGVGAVAGPRVWFVSNATVRAEAY